MILDRQLVILVAEELEVGVMVEIHHQLGALVVQQLADQEVLVLLQILQERLFIMVEEEEEELQVMLLLQVVAEMVEGVPEVKVLQALMVLQILVVEAAEVALNQQIT